jgi:predicted RNA-binding Zn ribbon-like protein
MQVDSKPPGELCLDFANTLRWPASDHPVETLLNYADMVEWARKFEVLTPRAANQLLKEAHSRADESQKVYKRGMELRESIYRIVLSHLQNRPCATDDLNRLNQELETAHRYLRIFPAENGYRLMWAKDDTRLDLVLWHVARSAAELLTSSETFSRVGQCADDRGCGWLFIDWSKNHSRRWCDINDCGNRAKQRRHYERSRKQR